MTRSPWTGSSRSTGARRRERNTRPKGGRTMASIVVDKTAKTLRTDALKDLGVTIRQIELRCKTCGEFFMTPAPLASGKFPRGWHECPKGCTAKRDKEA